MKPVMQTETGDSGNCFSACLASVLELPIEEVPNFFHGEDKSPEAWWRRARAWLETQGFGIVCMTVDSDHHDPLHWYHPDAYLIVAGKSERGRDHAIVCRGGRMIHDPHPSQTGIIRPESVDLLYPLDPSLIRKEAEVTAR